MASIKIKLYTGKTYKDGSHPIILQAIHNKRRKYVTTKYRATEKQWNFEKDFPSRNHPNSHQLKNRLRSILIDAEKARMKLEDKGLPFTIEQLMSKIESKKMETDFFKFISDHIQFLDDQEKFGNSKAYRSLKESFESFCGKKDVDFEDIDYKLIGKYEGFLVERGVKTNTVSFYLRTLRAIYNRAINEGVVDAEQYPFNKYKIKNESTPKRAISKEDIFKIRSIDLSGKPFLIMSRDIFMFSFYCMGINLIDIARIQNKQIINGRLLYKRKKTGRSFDIKLTTPALGIIAEYKKSEDPEAFVFPIIKRKDNEHLDYINYQRLINKQLKKVAALAEIDITLTTYVARHSWATLGKRAGIGTAVISEGLGHETEETTQIYLDSFETDVLDKANEEITG
jgi:integrase/recombinase XerD